MKALARTPHDFSRVIEWIGLAFLAVFTLVAIAGYWAFGLHPNLIPDSDFAREFYGLSFKLFARVHIVMAALVLAIKLHRHSDLRWVIGFVAVAGVSFLSEHIGTGYGFPFGGYEYTGLLGYKLGGRVPFLIPFSWFFMALPSWILAGAVFPARNQRSLRLLLGAYLLTVWDLSLDPAMSFLTPYWVWENPGPFFGMPWVNLAGWLGTGLVLMWILEWTGVHEWSAKLDLRWVLGYYGVVLLMPAGMLAAAGIWVPVLVTTAAFLPFVGLFLLARSSREPASNRALAGEQVGS